MKKIVILKMIALTSLVLMSCSEQGNPIFVSIPFIPSSLSGEVTYERNISKSELQFDPIQEEYSAFLVVPEAAENYNGAVDQLKHNIAYVYSLDPFSDLDYWTEINTTLYDYEYKTETSIFRTNVDFTQFEETKHVLIDSSNLYTYLKLNIQESYTHGMYLITYDGSHYMVEVIETDTKIYVKVLKLFEDPINRSMLHFVSITDKTSEFQNTTGRLLSDYINQGEFSFTFNYGIAADIDYWSQEDINFNGVDMYGFFNDNEYYVPTPTDWATTGEFISPDELTNLYSEGIVPAMIPSLISSLETGNGYIDFIDWDSLLLE